MTHDDGIRFERICEHDFDDIVALAAEAWYAADGRCDISERQLESQGNEVELSDGERARMARLMATDETATYLKDMTWGMKALLNGKVVGVIVTHGSALDAEASERWTHMSEEARRESKAILARLRDRGEHGNEPEEPAFLDEVRATDEMCDEAGLSNQPRVLLLVVSAAARGHGLGKRLLDRARDHFRRHGAERYWLVTDTDCDWPFYEHLGLARLAERTGAVAGAPERYFVYGGRA